MSKETQGTFNVNGLEVRVVSHGKDDDYISLTDLAKQKVRPGEDPSVAIQNWMRNRNTVELLGIWETLNNPDFKPLEFDAFKKRSGTQTRMRTEICATTPASRRTSC